MSPHPVSLPEQDVLVVSATSEQQPILANLVELYAYDFSEFLDIELDRNGRFGYAELPLYWTDPDRFPFLVLVAGTPAGFALVRKGSRLSGDPCVWDMAEFFLTRLHRRRGIGTRIACEVWRRFPGVWEIRVLEANRAALPFWANAIHRFTGQATAPARIQQDGKAWHVFRFLSRT